MKIKNWLQVLIMSALVTFAGSTAFAEPMTLKVGSFEPESHYLVQHVYIPYLKEIERRSNGEVKFKWYHGGSLVKAPQTVDALKGGIVDLVMNTGVFTQESKFPVTHVMTLPFLFESTVQADLTFQKAYQTIPQIKAEFEGLHALGFHVSDFFNLHVHTDKNPVKTLDDFKGLEIGAISATAISLTETLGATPRSLKPADLYVSLQRGAIDGVWFPTAPLAKWKLTDLTSNHSLVYGPFVLIPHMMSEQTWNKLAPETQQIFTDMQSELTNFTGAIVDNRRGSTISKIEARGDTIIVLPGDEKTKWIDATKPMYDAWLAKMDEIGVDGPAILAQIQAYAEEFKGVEYQDAEWWGNSWQE